MSAQTTTLLPPVGGMDLKSPLANMDPRFSPLIINFDSDGAKLSLRPAIKLHNNLGIVISDRIINLGVYGTSADSSSYKLYAWSNGGTPGIYNVTTTVASLSQAVSALANSVLSSEYKSRLWFSSGSGAYGKVFDGAAWAAVNFVDSSAANISFAYLATYKSRAYLFNQVGVSGANSPYWYTNSVDNVSGACTKVQLDGIFQSAGYLAFIATFAQADGVVNETYIAFGNTAGEVLIYSGDYPGASNWSIVGRFTIGKPLGYQPVINYFNDSYIMTDTGLVSLRNLFISGENASLAANISENIDPLWSKLVTNNSVSPFSYNKAWSGVFWPEQNKIVILTQGAIDENGEYSTDYATFLVFDLTSKAWTTYLWNSGAPGSYGVTSLTYYNKDLYFTFKTSVMRMSPDFTDFTDTNYTGTNQLQYFLIKGPHQSLVSQTSTKKVEGFEFLFKTDIPGGYIRVKSISDFGRRSSDYTSVDIIVATSATNGYNRAKYSVGTEGAFYQYILSGTAYVSTYGLEIYSVSTIFNSGGIKG